MTTLDRILDAIGVIPKPTPKPVIVRTWGGWKPTKEQTECPW